MLAIATALQKDNFGRGDVVMITDFGSYEGQTVLLAGLLVGTTIAALDYNLKRGIRNSIHVSPYCFTTVSSRNVGVAHRRGETRRDILRRARSRDCNVGHAGNDHAPADVEDFDDKPRRFRRLFGRRRDGPLVCTSDGIGKQESPVRYNLLEWYYGRSERNTLVRRRPQVRFDIVQVNTYYMCEYVGYTKYVFFFVFSYKVLDGRTRRE